MMTDLLTALSLLCFAIALTISIVLPVISACKNDIIEIIMAIKRKVK